VLESGSCFRCRSDWGKEGALCAHCKREGLYDAYFYSLFTHRRQRQVEVAAVRGGIADSAADPSRDAGAMRGNVGEAFLEDAPLLRLLSALSGWLNSQAAAEAAGAAAAQAAGGGGGAGGGGSSLRALCAEASRELELLAALKREIKACRALWSAHFDLLSQLDELGQGVSTMELRTRDDPRRPETTRDDPRRPEIRREHDGAGRGRRGAAQDQPARGRAAQVRAAGFPTTRG